MYHRKLKDINKTSISVYVPGKVSLSLIRKEPGWLWGSISSSSAFCLLRPTNCHLHENTQMTDECDDKIKRAEQKEKAVGRDSHHVSKRVISRVTVGTVRPQTDNQITHCIQLGPLYPPHKVNPTTETTADIITASHMEHARSDHLTMGVMMSWSLCDFSSPVVHFGSVVAGDVALISCGWRTDFPPLSLTVTHIITSDSRTDEALNVMRQRCATAHLLWQNAEPLPHSDGTVSRTSRRIVVQGHQHVSTAVCAQNKTSPLVLLICSHYNSTAWFKNGSHF